MDSVYNLPNKRWPYLPNVVTTIVMLEEKYRHGRAWPVYMRPSRRHLLDKLERYDNRARNGK